MFRMRLQLKWLRILDAGDGPLAALLAAGAARGLGLGVTRLAADVSKFLQQSLGSSCMCLCSSKRLS